MKELYMILALILGSVGSVALAASLLLLSDRKMYKISELLVSLAGGTLLGAAFLGMMPKAASMLNPDLVFKLMLGGIAVFFVLEKIILWRTCQNKDCQRQQDASAPLILIGDGFHNFIDGVVIVAAFHTSIAFGIAVSISVFAHEVPQEIADFGILIKNGYSRKKALIMNLISGSTALLGGLIAYYTIDAINNIVPYVLALSASSFIYIALADLVPQMHKSTKIRHSLVQISLIVLGIGIIYVIKNR